ncbi:hypothetical protein U6P01_12155 [Cutibacterium acnes]|jgi:hypothetical protein
MNWLTQNWVVVVVVVAIAWLLLRRGGLHGHGHGIPVHALGVAQRLAHVQCLQQRQLLYPA